MRAPCFAAALRKGKVLLLGVAHSTSRLNIMGAGVHLSNGERAARSAGEPALSEVAGAAVAPASPPAQRVQSRFCDLDVIDGNLPCPC